MKPTHYFNIKLHIYGNGATEIKVEYKIKKE